MKWRILCLLFVAVWAVMEPCEAVSLDKTQLLSAISAGEQGYRNVALHFKGTTYDDLGNEKLVPTGQDFEGTGLLGFGTVPKFKLNTTSHIHSSNNPGTYPKNRWDGSFDGSVGMEINYASDSPDTPYDGWVRAEPNNNELRNRAVNGGLEAFLPLYQGTGLSYFLKHQDSELPEWKILDSSQSDTVVIWHPFPDLRQSKDLGLGYVITLDLRRGCNIVGCQLWSNYGVPDQRLVADTTELVLEEKAGLWFPSRIKTVAYSYDAKSRQNLPYRVHETIAEWNDVNAPLGPDAFKLQFPAGIQVRDDVSGTAYKVGLPEAEEIEFISTAAEAMKVAASGTGGATSTGETGGAPAPRSAGATAITKSALGPAILLGTVAGTAVLVIAYLIFRRIRRFKRSATIGMLVAAAGLQGASGWTESLTSSSVAQPPTQGAAEVSYGNVRLPVENCAATTAKVLLAYYNYLYEPATVDEQIGATAAGAPLNALIGTLQSHGLQVEARTEVTLKGLQSYFGGGPNRTAVYCKFPSATAKSQLGHTYALSPAPEGVAAVDFPKGFRIVSWKEFERHLNTGNVIILLVQPDVAPDGEERKDVYFEPKKVDLGDMHWGQNKTFEAKLVNNNSFPVSMCTLKSPCVCTKVSMEKQVVPAHGSLPVKLEVIVDKWGDGIQQKKVMAFAADNSFASLTLEGRGPESRSLMVQPANIMLDYAQFAGGTPIERRIMLVGPQSRKRNQLKVTSTVPWVEAHLQDDKGSEAQDLSKPTTVAVTVLADKVEMSSEPLSVGIVRIEDSAAKEEVTVPVIVQHIDRNAFYTRPSTLLPKGPDGKEEIHLFVVAQSKNLEFRIVAVEAPGFETATSSDWVKEEASVTFKQISATAGAQVSLRVEEKDGGQQTLQVPVIASTS